ncbi:hypothetical protein [Dietzia lutea]|uniref:Uncharacterized protein n=1 Tax=Dietzia lutea TaxID=546160 RepID=A0A2S1RCZ7_9ACTN|nr:hypothetical protein [Dietzia lutea]AWH94145.1 hypothetical protein A6035_17560 [Dietzia lutea]
MSPPGSLAPLYAPVAGSLGIGDGATTVIEDPAVLIPVVLVGATVAAAVTFAPQIQQALLDAGIVLPPLPGLPAPAGAPAPAPAPPAPGRRSTTAAADTPPPTTAGPLP